MHLAMTAEDESFRQEVRAFIAANLPAEVARRQRQSLMLTSNTEDTLQWMGILDRRGWSVPHWDPAHGGTGWSPMQMFIFEDELHQADAPEFHWVSTHMAGPIIYKFGSEEQKQKFLPSIRRGDYIWCQGFSEPGSGSDLASLKTAAVLKGDHFRINGQKIWTSAAFEAAWGFFLVRTNPAVKPQAGISFLLIDMKSEGVTIRRIPQINGEADVCEVFLDNVMVPRANLIGELDKGWTYAKALLEHERTVSSYIYYNKRELRRTREIAQSQSRHGRPLADDPLVRQRLAELEMEVTALEWSVLRVLAEEETRYGTTAAASVLKLTGSRLQQAITEFQCELAGTRAARFFDPYAGAADGTDLWPEDLRGRGNAAMLTRAATILGGTEQVQKNILSKLAFGL